VGALHVPTIFPSAFFQPFDKFSSIPCFVAVSKKLESFLDGEPDRPLAGVDAITLSQTAPMVLQQPHLGIGLNEAGADRIEVDVVHEGFEIAAAGRVDEDGLIASAKDMPPEGVACIEPSGVGILKPLHPGHQIGLRSLNHPVVVIGHQNPGINAPATALAAFAQSLQKHGTIFVVFEDGFAPVAAAHDVIESAGEFNAGLAGHKVEDAEGWGKLSRIVD